MDVFMIFWYCILLYFLVPRAVWVWSQPQRVKMVRIGGKPKRWITFGLFAAGTLIMLIALGLRVKKVW